MKFRALVAALLLTITAGAAMAARCPLDMKLIDEALAAGPDLSQAQLAEVKRLRAEGEQLHEQGKHGASVDALDEAKDILDI